MSWLSPLHVLSPIMHQVSSGAVDRAKSNLEKMLILCAKEIEPDQKTDELIAAQKKSFHEVTHELVRQVTSPNTLVREQVSKPVILCLKQTSGAHPHLALPRKNLP